jgi:beta-glucosidase
VRLQPRGWGSGLRQPAIARRYLRKQWGFSGYVVSDCGAVGDIFRGHNVAPSMAAASARAVKAGTDLDCGSEYRSLIPALEQKLIEEAEIDAAVRRLLTARFRLGTFDPPERVSYARIPYSVVESAAHQTLALEGGAQVHRAAEESGRAAAAEEVHQDAGRDRSQRR